MAVEHRDIPEDGLHEPKGASNAAPHRVYVADGTGGGQWSLVDSDSLRGTINNSLGSGRRVVTDGSGGLTSDLTPAYSFGTMNLTGNSAAQTVTAASDPTLNTNSDFVELTVSLDYSSVQNMVTGANYIEVSEAGLYLIDFWCNVSSDTATTKFSLKFVKNEVDFVDRGPKLTMDNSGRFSNMAANGIHEFSGADQIKLFIAADKNCNITIEDMTFRMVYLGSF